MPPISHSWTNPEMFLLRKPITSYNSEGSSKIIKSAYLKFRKKGGQDCLSVHSNSNAGHCCYCVHCVCYCVTVCYWNPCLSLQWVRTDCCVLTKKVLHQPVTAFVMFSFLNSDRPIRFPITRNVGEFTSCGVTYNSKEVEASWKHNNGLVHLRSLQVWLS